MNTLFRRISVKVNFNGRFLSTQADNHSEQKVENKPIFDYNTRVTCTFRNDPPLEIHTVWLRHHCQCEQCYNYKTNQRIQIPSALPQTSSPTNASVENDYLLISWDDGHVSKYRKDWLIKNVPRPITKQNYCFDNFNETSPELLFGHLKNKIQLRSPLDTAVSYKDFMGSNEGVSQLLQNILQHGFGIVNECPAEFETTKKIIRKVSHPQNTIYGDVYEWTSDLAHADTAYTSDIVHLHTDTSYFTEPIGLQIFHCLKHEGTGGVNWLADGFHKAQKIAQTNPKFYRALSSISVPCQYIDTGKHHFHSNDFTFGHDWDSDTGKIQKIRYNPHDMAVLKDLPLQNVAEFYESLVYLSDTLENDPIHIKLTPGLVIFLDNWRILHGRAAFTGFRHLCGAYISRSDWLSRARTFKLIP